MNKAGVAKRLAERTGITKAVARDAVDGMFTAIGDAVAGGEEVQIARFGTFCTRSKSACTGRDSRTDEAVSIAASTSPMFMARGKTLKDAVKSGGGGL